MSFIKRGDGKILSVIEEEDLNENAKKVAKKLSDNSDAQEQNEPNNSSKLEK